MSTKTTAFAGLLLAAAMTIVGVVPTAMAQRDQAIAQKAVG